MNNFALRSCLVVCALVWIGCGSGDGDSNPTNSGGTQGGGSGGAQQGGSSAGGTTASGGAQQGGSSAGGTLASGGTSSGAGGVAGSGAGSGGTSAGTGGSSAGGGGSGGDSFACGPLTCQRGEQVCRRELPGLPGGSEQRMCEPFPNDCAEHDCSCFCDSNQTPCQTQDFCMCSGQDGQIELVCAGA